MEVLLVVLFFLVTMIFFVAGKDDFGRKEINLKANQKEEATNDINDEPKEAGKKEEVKNEEVKNEEVKKEEVKNEEVKKEEVKNEEVKKEEVKNEEVKTDINDEPKEAGKKEVE